MHSLSTYTQSINNNGIYFHFSEEAIPIKNINYHTSSEKFKKNDILKYLFNKLYMRYHITSYIIMSISLFETNDLILINYR